MVFVVPFDGSALAAAALSRAGEFQEVFDERVVALSVVPKNDAEFARQRVGLDPEADTDPETVATRLRAMVRRIAPDADFRCEFVGRYAPPGEIANEIRSVARELDADMVFVGSDNAGQLVNSLANVGSSVAADDAYDVVIVKHADH